MPDQITDTCLMDNILHYRAHFDPAKYVPEHYLGRARFAESTILRRHQFTCRNASAKMRRTAVATEKRHAVRVPRAPNTALVRNMPSSHPSCYSRISIPHAGNPKMYYSIEGALGSPDSSTALLHLNTNLVHHWDTSSSSSLCSYIRS